MITFVSIPFSKKVIFFMFTVLLGEITQEQNTKKLKY